MAVRGTKLLNIEFIALNGVEKSAEISQRSVSEMLDIRAELAKRWSEEPN